jgi:CheY-like chemotaxis protein/tetratricopeptide (TPR) repeat protein
MSLADQMLDKIAGRELSREERACLQGKFHNEVAFVLRNLGVAENREDYLERALVEYATASAYFEQAGHPRERARAENSLGLLLFTLSRFAEAHEHLERAGALFADLKERAQAAQVDDARAKVLLAEGRSAEAERLSRSALERLEDGGEASLLAEALTTHGKALARLGRCRQAQAAFERAAEVSERAGDFERAGLAMLSMVEELGDRLMFGKLCRVYIEADRLLSKSQETQVLKRLNSCAGWIVRTLAGCPSLASFPIYRRSREAGAAFAESGTEDEMQGWKEEAWDEFCLKEEVRRYEARVIERALKESDGVVSRASQLLGFRHHNSLIALLNTRHKNLLHARSPIIPRRRSIIRETKNVAQSTKTEERARPIIILHVEDNRMVAEAVKERLEAEGWKVVICAEGATALKVIESNVHYDLLLVDNDLPGISGLELVRQARRLSHRESMPIAMLSASDCVTEAHRAGANIFLRKPEDIPTLVETIEHLLNVNERPV